ncbi:hypothetical protein [Devosia sp.]|uniref:hypothetical protein n=1 Tax=Devosia sp. TaxID=1871048 RepID=UPI003BAC6FEE
MLKYHVIALSMVSALSLTSAALADTMVRGRSVPDHELGYVKQQCATLLAREQGNSNNEWDSHPQEAAVPSGNSSFVKSLDLEALSLVDCRKAGLVR